MESLKETIKNGDERILREALNRTLQDLGYANIQVRSLKISHIDSHLHSPCKAPMERVCYWDLYTGKQICKCV